MDSICSTVYNTLALAKASGYPMLLMSPPGWGKTTTVKNWAAANGYHCEILNGARFEAEAVEGYQVNEAGKEALVHKNPSWFQRIWEKEREHIPTLLFCDELSGAKVQTQNALLNLLDGGRTIGEGKKLPDSTLVVAASNYAENVDERCTIIPSNLNRFCIINLLEDIDPLDLVGEFLTDRDSSISPKFEINDLPKEVKDLIDNKFMILTKNLVKEYMDRDNSKGFIDILHPNVSDLYHDCPQGELYNYVSGRTMSNFGKVICGFVSLGLNDENFMKKISRGFFGIGTGHFVNKAQINSYNSSIDNSIKSILSEIKGMVRSEKRASFNYGKEDPTTLVAQILSYKEESKNLLGDTASEKKKMMDELSKMISEKYSKVAENVFKFEKDVAYRSKFFSDFEAIFELLHGEEKIPTELVTFAQVYDAYYSQLIGKQLFPNVSQQGAFKNYSSSLYRCSILALRNGEPLPKNEKEIADYVKYEKIIQVGVTSNYSKKLYKMLYNSKVHGDQIFDVVEGYSPIYFTKDNKLVTKDWSTLREDAMMKKN